jgi:hypothetical protein
MLKLGNIHKLIQRGKCPLASLEEMESNETTMSTDGDRVSDLVREGKMNCTILQKYFYV